LYVAYLVRLCAATLAVIKLGAIEALSVAVLTYNYHHARGRAIWAINPC
jgi:hypothetical protein